MATIETVDFGALGKFTYTNVSTPVGEGETNDKSDVLLIQTLFKLIGINEVYTRALFGFDPSDLPDLNGVCDRKTIRAIWGFQRMRRYRLLNADGKVHPGKYQNRVLKGSPVDRQMMITLLNMNAAQVGNYHDLVSVIRGLAPSIIFNGKAQAAPAKPAVK